MITGLTYLLRAIWSCLHIRSIREAERENVLELLGTTDNVISVNMLQRTGQLIFSYSESR